MADICADRECLPPMDFSESVDVLIRGLWTNARESRGPRSCAEVAEETTEGYDRESSAAPIGLNLVGVDAEACFINREGEKICVLLSLRNCVRAGVGAVCPMAGP